MPTMTVVLVLALIRAVQVFDQVFVLTGGGPGTATMYMVQYIYRTAFDFRNYGLAAAASLILAIVLLVLTIGQLAISRNQESSCSERWISMNSTAPQGILAFLTRRHAGKRLDISDIISYLYLIVGTLLMFGPVVWLVMSSFKPLDGIYEFPPTFLPYKQETVQVKGYDQPLPLYDVKMADGSVRRLAQISQVGIGARMIDPKAPDDEADRCQD